MHGVERCRDAIVMMMRCSPGHADLSGREVRILHKLRRAGSKRRFDVVKTEEIAQLLQDPLVLLVRGGLHSLYECSQYDNLPAISPEISRKFLVTHQGVCTGRTDEVDHVSVPGNFVLFSRLSVRLQ